MGEQVERVERLDPSGIALLDREDPGECVARMTGLDEATRSVTHVISTDKLDRGSRIIDQEGWQLSDFRKNPIVLADHNYELASIIGSCTKVGVVGGALTATTQFGEVGMGPLAMAMVQAGLARAWSVGWQGLKSHQIGSVPECAVCADLAGKVQYGTHYTKQALLEYSLIPVPANPDAVMAGLEVAGFKLTKSDRDSLVRFVAATTPAKAAAPDGANAGAEATITPRRSPEFYDGLFGLTRLMTRKVAAKVQADIFKPRS